MLTAHLLSLLLQLLLLLVGWQLPADFRSESVRRTFEGLSDGSLSKVFMLNVVLARVAITSSSDAVESAGKTLAIELEALAVAAITTSEMLRWCLQLALSFHLARVYRCAVAKSVKI